MSVSRNAPCPCGSGKKYKQCCGKQAETGINLDALLNQAFGLHQAGHLPQAAALYQQILAQRPNHPDALHLLGLALQQAGRLDEAKRMIEQAVRIKPDAPMFRHNLANLLLTRKQFTEAANHALKVLKQSPGLIEARHVLGTAYKEMGNTALAAHTYTELLASHPTDMRALMNLGNLMLDSGKPDAARDYFSSALSLDPLFADAVAGLGESLRAMGQTAQAEAIYLRHLESRPNDENVLLRLASLQKDACRHSDAERTYRQALDCDAGSIQGHLGLAAVLLCQGRLREGWQEYGWRLKEYRPDGLPRRRPYFQPEWAGQDLHGKRILVWGEQGLGDEILFAGLIGDLVEMGASVTIECGSRLIPIFSRSFPDTTVLERTHPPHPLLAEGEFDLQIAAGSLASVARPEAASFPSRAAYLFPESGQLSRWTEWAGSLPFGFRVGISWRSMYRNAGRNPFYTELCQWKAVLNVKGVSFVNLQYGDCEDELREAESLFGVTIHRAPGLDLKDDLDGAAALTRTLDLVIAPNTSVFAMAGAVGTPTWLLNLDSDWTMLGTDRMPWFPSVEVFAKSWEEPWENVLSKVAARLSRMAEAA